MCRYPHAGRRPYGGFRHDKQWDITRARRAGGELAPVDALLAAPVEEIPRDAAHRGWFPHDTERIGVRTTRAELSHIHVVVTAVGRLQLSTELAYQVGQYVWLCSRVARSSTLGQS